MSLSDGFSKRTWWPFWKVGTDRKQNGLATFCGKLPPSYKKTNRISHLRTISSSVVKHVVVNQNKVVFEEVLEKVFILLTARFKEKRVKSVEEGKPLYIHLSPNHLVEWLSLNHRTDLCFRKKCTINQRGEGKGRLGCLSTRTDAVVMFYLFMFYFLFFMIQLRQCRRCLAICGLCEHRALRGLHEHELRVKPDRLQQVQRGWYWSGLLDHDGECTALLPTTGQNGQNGHVQDKGLQVAMTPVVNLLQVTFNLTLIFICTSIQVFHIVYEAIFNCTINFTVIFYFSACIRVQQASKISACPIYLQLLSDSTVVKFTLLRCFWSCLRRSFPEECLNIIEIYTWSTYFELDSQWHVIGMSTLTLNVHELYRYKDLNLHRSYKSCAYLHEVYRKIFSKKWILKSCLYINLQKMFLLLCGDVELNPGPHKLMLMTQNCRGLQDYNKLRSLLRNKMAVMNKNKAVLALQETHLLNDDMIKWSGNYVISSSASTHSAGCITYFNDYVRIMEVRQIDNQGHGHVIVVDGLMLHTTIIANVYSPVRSLGREQENFYNNLIEIIEELEQKYLFNEPNLIILGDFNLPLELDRNCYSNDSELDRARSISERLLSKGLTDCWKINDDRFTYKTAQSRLDRIMFRLDTEYVENLETDWTFTTSDHCLLKLSLNPARENPTQSRVVSLPTYLLENEEAVKMMKDKMTEMVVDSMDYWEPKMKLEYLKMCLRTVVGEVTKYYNKKVNEELEGIQKDITWRMGRIRGLPLYALAENNLQLDLLFTKRNLILEERSKKLAEKAKTKWFYEGERSKGTLVISLTKTRSTPL